MRVVTPSIGVLLFATTAYAQVPCASLPLAYDPYKPSDVAIVRQYGGAVMSQVPLSTLLKLDPYVPSQGELLRLVGRGIPVWMTYPGYPAAPPPPAADCPPASGPPARSAAPLTTFGEVLTELERAGATPGSATVTPTSSATGADRDTGVRIQYAGRTWTSAGAAVPLRDSEFVLAGKSAGFPVFRRAGTSDDVIFVPTTRGMVAPFRAAP